MKLLTHPKIPADSVAALQRAVDAVELCQTKVQNAGAALHLAVKHLPPEKERPSDELAAMRWDAMRRKRDQQIHFACSLIGEEELALLAANELLAKEVEKFRAVASSLHAAPFHQECERAASVASLNLLVSDNLCSHVIANGSCSDWPKSIIGRSLPDDHAMRRLFKASRRGFTYRYKTGNAEWAYFQDRFSNWLAANVPTAPCLTEEEAELDARGWALSIARSTRSDVEYTVQTWDIENGCPGSLCLTGLGKNEDHSERGGLTVYA